MSLEGREEIRLAKNDGQEKKKTKAKKKEYKKKQASKKLKQERAVQAGKTSTYANSDSHPNLTVASLLMMVP